ncbi:MAG: type II toxin-antitoxin system RelE/ParE family toxin [Lachnospiraceae bacterium]|nr:type II toxin-antitoxin system RelE/ParE family toxin [Lachnospiraceae bacterium]
MSMNDYRISLTPKARDDITGIGDYIAFTLSEPDTSEKFIKGLRNSISQLKFFPYKFPLIQDSSLQNRNIRCMPYKNYCIFYEVAENGRAVIILRVGYNKRNWKNILT